MVIFLFQLVFLFLYVLNITLILILILFFFFLLLFLCFYLLLLIFSIWLIFYWSFFFLFLSTFNIHSLILFLGFFLILDYRFFNNSFHYFLNLNTSFFLFSLFWYQCIFFSNITLFLNTTNFSTLRGVFIQFLHTFCCLHEELLADSISFLC